MGAPQASTGTVVPSSLSNISPKALAKAVEQAIYQQLNTVEPTREEVISQIPHWLAAGKEGTINGRQWSDSYYNQMQLYSRKYLEKLPPKISTPLTIDSLRIVLARTEGFSNKRWFYDCYRSLTLYFVLTGKLPALRRDESKQIKPILKGEQKKKFITKDEKCILIVGVWQSPGLSFYEKFYFVVLIEFAYITGLRISEILSISIENIDPVKQEVYLPETKGGKPLKRGFNKKLANLVAFLIKIRPKSTSNKLFLLANGKPLSRKTATQRLIRLRERLGLPDRVSWHGFRSQFITRNLNAGISLNQVRIAANHKDCRTTQRYVSVLINESVEIQKEWN